MSSEAENTCQLSGVVRTREVLRYTPGGVPCLGFQLEHSSRQMEAGVSRQVMLNIAAMALGEPALLLNQAPLPTTVQLIGFLAPHNHRIPRPVLHVRTVHFIEPTSKESFNET